MARAINILLDVGDRSYDINDMGLVNMSFDRYLGSTKDIESGILSNLDITMFDQTGYKLLSILQKQSGKIKFKYGFEDNLSDLFVLNNLKYKATYNNMGVMISIGAYAFNSTRKFKSEVYVPGTSVGSMLETFSARNNWYIGRNRSHIQVGDLKIDQILHKTEKETDMSFIVNKLLPICNRVITEEKTNNITNLWDVRLIYHNSRLEFYFQERNTRLSRRRVWDYSYGYTTDNNIIEFTNSVDLSFLINGLTVQIPMTASDFLISEAQIEEKEKEFQSIIDSRVDDISALITRYGLPYVKPDQFLWKVELIESEDVDTTDYESLVLERVNNIMNALNTIELTVIGNPEIQPTDLISLTIKNKDGSLNLLSSNSSVGGYWRVVKINENIGISGYTTTLSLVREKVILPEKNSIEGN